ncbi:helix-hairpin-helix domain-containing protein [Brumimicrobium salinarum]|uniref:hypothetical protein n=1 Tax=Brumimicrobium salinarum TaxID=2058658 RepID=UPI00196B10BD|nr:hypothetical protein [Brumimicrobium salinarum]
MLVSCPVCEKERKPTKGFLSALSAPARRALEHEGILSADQLSAYTEKDILKLHGVGPASMPTLKKKLSEKELKFKEP